MKLLFRGGLNKLDPDGWKKSYFYEYSEIVKKLIVKGRKICFVTMAKPDHYFDKYIIPQFGETVDTIGNGTKNVDWNKYDLIFLCGGDTIPLKEGLLKKKFSTDILKKYAVVLGDSAGAMLMTPYFYDSPDRKSINFIKGIYPDTKTIVIVHTNNPNYCNEFLIDKVESFAKEKGLYVLKLKENETKLYDERNKKFLDFNFEELFNKD